MARYFKAFEQGANIDRNEAENQIHDRKVKKHEQGKHKELEEEQEGQIPLTVKLKSMNLLRNYIPIKTMVILGSGGHTKEMLTLLTDINR